MPTPPMPDAIVKLDDRGRIHLKQFVPQPIPGRWALYTEDDGKTVILKAIEGAAE